MLKYWSYFYNVLEAKLSWRRTCIIYVDCFTVTLGSSGGKGGLNSNGGVGGGILFLNISDRVTVNGKLRVNGENAPGSYAGGGSGGSLYLVTKRFDGSGLIQVTF